MSIETAAGFVAGFGPALRMHACSFATRVGLCYNHLGGAMLSG